MNVIGLQNLSKNFGQVKAVNDLSLSVITVILMQGQKPTLGRLFNYAFRYK